MSNATSPRKAAKPVPVEILVAAEVPQTPSSTARTSKQAQMLALLQEGATLAAMQAATGWQPHSVRGFISGVVRKKLGFDVTVEKTAAGSVYRIGA